LIVGYYLPTYSQLYNRPQKNRLKIDTSYSNLSLKNNFKTPDLVISFDSKWFFNNSRNNKKLIYPKFTDKNPEFGHDPIAIFQTPLTFDNMPCVKPQGFFPMPVVRILL
jgi:hypothetical protein